LPKILILAGGFGTRLYSVVNELPKPLAPIEGKPFLDYQISELRKYYNDTKIYLLTHHLSDKIESYYSNTSNVEIIKEDIPLGTGGAIKNAIKAIGLTNNDSLLVLNGDTYMKPDLYEFINQSSYDVNILSMHQKDCERSSTLIVEGKTIKEFSEQGKRKRDSYISMGCYYIKDSSFIINNHKKCFMIENEFIEYIKKDKIGTYLYEGVFIDIGIPKDYEKMREYIKKNEN
jgi:D-glycero-alpha-D-manno-heptose 1-phosphate guanylyltransferase|tara:strand:+ start:3954 stop:4646 length:693 start_codon:yes stop_codon:yes gene_type:complete